MSESERLKSVDRDPDSPPEKVDVTQLHNVIMREKLEPKDGYEPVPLWLVGVLGAFVFWGGYYLAKNGADFNSSVLDGSPVPVAASVGPVAQAIDPMELGKKLYTANCVSCHAANGAGQPGTYPPLDASEWVTGDASKLARIVMHGLAGPVKVKGATYNGNMPTFAAKLNDEKMASVLTYIRGNWSNRAEAVKAEAVAAVRSEFKDRKDPWSEAELMSP